MYTYVFMYMYVSHLCLHGCVYICIFVCMCISICVYVYMHVCTSYINIMVHGGVCQEQRFEPMHVCVHMCVCSADSIRL